jgi:hypothetical protein
MASLLERMNLPSKSNGGVGPIRAKSTNRASPYNREHGRESRTPKGNVDAAWSHDLFEGNRSLSERLSSSSSSLAPKPNFGVAQKALKDAIGSEASGTGGLNIKGASSVKEGNVVQVSGLVKGTTPADVEAIFKRCGPVLSSKLHSTSSTDSVTIRIIFKAPESAATAVQKFHNQTADGRTLSVTIVGGAGVSLGGRLGLGLEDAGVIGGSVDVLMESGDAGGSKMRSDSILASDPRASVLVAPPGTDPKEYTQQQSRSRGRGGRGRGGRRGGGGRKAGMDLD